MKPSLVPVLIFWFGVLLMVYGDARTGFQNSDLKITMGFVLIAVSNTISYIKQSTHNWPKTKYFNLFFVLAVVAIIWFAAYIPKNATGYIILLLGVMAMASSFFGKSQKTTTKNI